MLISFQTQTHTHTVGTKKNCFIVFLTEFKKYLLHKLRNINKVTWLN